MIRKIKYLKERYELWKEWCKRSGNTKFYKIGVLLGIIVSPTFEIFCATRAMMNFINGVLSRAVDVYNSALSGKEASTIVMDEDVPPLEFSHSKEAIIGKVESAEEIINDNGESVGTKIDVAISDLNCEGE